MVTIIITGAGPGPLPDRKPTWLLRHPLGSILLCDVIASLSFSLGDVKKSTGGGSQYSLTRPSNSTSMTSTSTSTEAVAVADGSHCDDGKTNVSSAQQQQQQQQSKEAQYRIILAVSSEHIDQFCGGSVDGILELVHRDVLSSVNESVVSSAHSSLAAVAGTAVDSASPPVPLVSFEIFVLPRRTNSAPETAVEVIEGCNVHGPIFLKDADGAFEHTIEAVPDPKNASNYIVAMQITPLNQHEIVDLTSKSFVEHTGGLLTNIQEKQIVSDCICVGGYAFESAELFTTAVREVLEVRKRAQSILFSSSEGQQKQPAAQASGVKIFVSHIVQHLRLNKKAMFTVSFTTNFRDYKTEQGWKRCVQAHRNIMLPIEGVLFDTWGCGRSNIFSVDDLSTWKPVRENLSYLCWLRSSLRGGGSYAPPSSTAASNISPNTSPFRGTASHQTASQEGRSPSGGDGVGTANRNPHPIVTTATSSSSSSSAFLRSRIRIILTTNRSRTFRSHGHQRHSLLPTTNSGPSKETAASKSTEEETEEKESRLTNITQKNSFDGFSIEDLLHYYEVPFDDVVYDMSHSTTLLVGCYADISQAVLGLGIGGGSPSAVNNKWCSEPGREHPSAVAYCIPECSPQLGTLLQL